MKRAKVVKRNFNMSDGVMLQLSKLRLALFIEYKSLFIERFPLFVDPFAANWEAAIEYAYDMPTDFSVTAIQKGESRTLNGLMSRGRNLYQTLIVYTQLAFPDDAMMLKLMGQPQYEKARKSNVKLPLLLSSAFAQASKPEIKVALMTKGMKEAEISELETHPELIVKQHGVFKKAKKERSKQAKLRIVAMNAVWASTTLVCQCANLVFVDDATRYKMFVIYKEKKKKKEEEE